jgi:hypothetical protein
MPPQAVALRCTSIIRVRLRMPGRVDHGGAYALLGTAGTPPPNIATSAHAVVRYPRSAASSSVQRLAPHGRRNRLESRFEQRDAIAISDGCYLDSTFFTGANDPVEPECRPASPAGRKPSSQNARMIAAVLCASLLGLGMAFLACTLLLPAWGLDGSGALFPGYDRLTSVVCSSGDSSKPPQTARADE